jgi:hypothetical protein
MLKYHQFLLPAPYLKTLFIQEKQQEIEAMKNRHHHHDDDYYDDFKPAWSPASKLIPCGR